ncbi:ketopantoate reductase family protein [Cohnella lupini]|uniref:2-dehydropantoate 2-reductase n=1 Tax=Cohnella lupini TaxID=1294267 RepID=A0A3D9IVQ9_9BACL|nr:2-dehydropantoate 2-reductase [Cohnella lupini]RED65765.1 2-dehydropantoate 2-reductase [Cohnella lupini]
MNKVAVLGGGSLGLLLAGKLKASGCDCVLWTRTRLQASLVNARGITIEEREGDPSTLVPIEARPFEDVKAFDGFLLLAVKQTAIKDDFVIRLAEIVPVGGVIVLLQNGIGHAELLEQALPGRKLVIAVTSEGARRIDETTVRHTGIGETRLGEDVEVDKEHLLFIEREMKQAGLSVYLSKHLKDEILRKLLVNAVINPTTAILRIRNGEITQSKERLEFVRSLFAETFGILRSEGLSADESGLWNALLNVSQATSLNESSMLQDVLAGKETEIEFINGAIGRMAARQGKESPWNNAVTALVKAIH